MALGGHSNSGHVTLNKTVYCQEARNPFWLSGPLAGQGTTCHTYKCGNQNLPSGGTSSSNIKRVSEVAASQCMFMSVKKEPSAVARLILFASIGEGMITSV